MRAHRFAITILIASTSGCLSGCGNDSSGSGSGAGSGDDSSASGTDPGSAPDPKLASCDGSGGNVPGGFPALGSSGCGFHATYTYDSGNKGTVEVADDLGAQPVGRGRYDLSGGTDWDDYKPYAVRLRLPSLAAGDYATQPACAALEAEEGGYSYDSYGEGDDQGAPFLDLTIAGSDGTVVWGTFSARACTVTQVYEDPYNWDGVDYVYGCVAIPSGTFAARIESATKAEPMTPPLVAACSTEPGYPGVKP
jgi:hypothetical protein